jgi:ankyrin repeat protein
MNRLLNDGSMTAELDMATSSEEQYTPLHLAAAGNHLTMVERLLDEGHDPHARSEDGSTPILVAAERGHLTVVERLLKEKVDPDPRSVMGWTPLHHAASRGHILVVDRLLKERVDPKSQTVDGLTALHWSAMGEHVDVTKRLLEENLDPNSLSLNGTTPLHLAAVMGHELAVEQLLQAGAVTGICTLDGMMPTHSAAVGGNPVVFELLLSVDADFSLPTKEGYTTLRLAAAFGHLDIVERLLGLGMDPNSKANDGTTPLHLAAQKGYVLVTQQLLQAGANAQIRSNEGLTPLHFAVDQGHVPVILCMREAGVDIRLESIDDITSLENEASSGRLAMVDLLLSLGADPDTSKETFKPLHFAAAGGYLGIVESLLQAGANADIRSPDKTTPLHLAAQNGFHEVVDRLLKARVDVEASSGDGRRPLHYAAQNGHVAVSLQLAKAGVNLEAQTMAGHTPLHVAAAGGHSGTIECLLELGANINAQDTRAMTALHHAAGKGNLSGAKRLLEGGSNPSSLSLSWNTPLDLAQLGGFLVVARLLRRIQVAKNHWPDEENLDQHICFVNLLTKILNPTFVMEVPYLCEHGEYDNKGFSGFPERMGWKHYESNNALHLVPADSVEKSPEEHASVLQAWLFFGMLTEVLGISGVEVKAEDFIREKGGRLLITTARLPAYLSQWAEKEKAFPAIIQKEHIVKFDACLQEASSFTDQNLSRAGGVPPAYLNEWAGQEKFFPAELQEAAGSFEDQDVSRKADDTANSSLSDEVSLSILILGEILASGRNSIWDQQTRLYGDSKHSNVIISQRSNLLGTPGEISEDNFPIQYFTSPGHFTYNQMIKRRWCVSEALMLHKNLRPISLFLMSMLNRPKMKTEHSSCSGNQCFANQIVEEGYKTKHTTNECKCSHVEVNTDEICRILSRGHIPSVIIGVSGKDEAINLHVVNGERYKYVAVSHVWSHGLGNVHSNSLPRCQLLRLKRMTDALYERREGDENAPRSIWIDTLCIPRVLEGRKLALKMLRKAFEKAHRVLVLDAELLQATSLASDVDILARILCCGWLRRLWTLEEALVARQKLRVQLLEGAVDVYARMQVMVRDYRGAHVVPHGGCLDLVSAFNEFAPAKFGKFDRHHDLEYLGLSLQYRTTSKKEDEVICLASLLGLDVGKLLQSPAEQRLRVFYSLLGNKEKIPSSILFVDGPRLQSDGYRWAPSSFLTTSHVRVFGLHIPTPPARSGELGLYVTFPGWLLHHRDVSLTSPFSFEDTHEHCWYAVTPADEGTGTGAWKDLGLTNSSTIALLYTPWCVADGVLVAVQRSDLGVLYSKFLWKVHVHRTHLDESLSLVKETQRYDELKKLSWELLGRGDAKFQASTLPSVKKLSIDQRWCIG